MITQEIMFKKPLARIDTAEDCRNSPDYSGTDSKEIEKHFQVKFYATYSISFDNQNLFLEIDAFIQHLVELRVRFVDRIFYSAVTSFDKKVVSISLFYKLKTINF